MLTPRAAAQTDPALLPQGQLRAYRGHPCHGKGALSRRRGAKCQSSQRLDPDEPSTRMGQKLQERAQKVITLFRPGGKPEKPILCSLPSCPVDTCRPLVIPTRTGPRMFPETSSLAPDGGNIPALFGLQAEGCACARTCERKGPVPCSDVTGGNCRAFYAS